MELVIICSLLSFTDGTTTASYKYNASGLRYEKTVNGETVNHVWDGSKQIVADVIDNQFYEADCYIRGTNLVAKYNYQNGNKSDYTYYTQNAHGDVVNLTDETGKVTKTYTYDAFGVEKNIDENDTNAFRYCGEYYDAETGTIYLRARYYNPSNGRFISRDSYAGKLNDPLSLNLYTYCQNNPIFYIDPTGHIAGVDDVFIIGALAVTYAVSAAASLMAQPQVQQGLSTAINKVSHGINKFNDCVVELSKSITSWVTTNASQIGNKTIATINASQIGNATLTAICRIAEFTGIKSELVLSPSTGLMTNFSTTVDEEYNPYLAPWKNISWSSKTKARDDAGQISASKRITQTFPNHYTVYRLVDKSETTQYVGRTGDLNATIRRHARNVYRADLNLVPIAQGLSYEQFRGLEQVYIEYYGTINKMNKANNQINGVNPNNTSIYNYYMDIAMHYLMGETYVGG